MFYYLIRKLLFLIDPEKAHTLTLKYFNSKKIQILRKIFLNQYHLKKLHVWD